MIRRLLWLALVVLAGWLIRSLVRKRSQPAPEAPAGTGQARFEGAMVRDRVCNTFLPRSRALRVRHDGEDHYFCSESCRSTFLAGRKAAS